MKSILLTMILIILPLSLASAHTGETVNDFSRYLQQKMVQQPSVRPKTRRRIIRKKTVNIKVEVYSTQHYTVDLLVTCQDKNILLTYNKTNKKFCTVKFKCKNSLRAAIRPYCR